MKIAKTPTYKLTKIPYSVRSGPTAIAVLGVKINAVPSNIGRKPVNFIIADKPIDGASFSSMCDFRNSKHKNLPPPEIRIILFKQK